MSKVTSSVIPAKVEDLPGALADPARKQFLSMQRRRVTLRPMPDALICTYECTYNCLMFDWDKSKAERNARKHGIAFPDTFAVFDDPNAITIEETDQEEERFTTIGMDAFGRLLVVVYTWRSDVIRIISARKANNFEVSQYES